MIGELIHDNDKSYEIDTIVPVSFGLEHTKMRSDLQLLVSNDNTFTVTITKFLYDIEDSVRRPNIGYMARLKNNYKTYNLNLLLL
jgi:hypothetical protein